MSSDDSDRFRYEIVDANATYCNGSNFLLHEMTQDVIEWDESNNVELGGTVRSPHPMMSSGKRNRESNITPNSTTSIRSTNSSLFASLKCQLDPSKLQAVGNESPRGGTNNRSNENSRITNPKGTPKAEKEIDGILKILEMEDASNIGGSMEMTGPSSTSLLEMPTQQRHNKRPALGERSRYHTHPQYQQSSSSTSVAIRHRRRKQFDSQAPREGSTKLMQQQQQHHQTKQKQKHVRHRSSTIGSKVKGVDQSSSSIGTPTSKLRHSETNTEAATSDDFAELLKELATPSMKPSRPPLTSVNQNSLSAINIVENMNDLCSSECVSENGLKYHLSSKENLNTRRMGQSPGPTAATSSNLPNAENPNQSDLLPHRGAVGSPQRNNILLLTTLPTQKEPLRQSHVDENPDLQHKSEYSLSSSSFPQCQEKRVLPPLPMSKDDVCPPSNAPRPIENSRSITPPIATIPVTSSNEQPSTRVLPLTIHLPSTTTIQTNITDSTTCEAKFDEPKVSSICNDDTMVDDDEYGDLFLSIDDLAMIDAATQSRLHKVDVAQHQQQASYKTHPPIARQQVKDEIPSATTSRISGSDGIMLNEAGHAAAADRITGVAHRKPTNLCSKGKPPPPLAVQSYDGLGPSNIALDVNLETTKLASTNPETKEAADFGEFPSDIDWKAMDELVIRNAVPANPTQQRSGQSTEASGKANSSASVSSLLPNSTNLPPTKRTDETIVVASEEDDFGEFPDDIDFDAIDQVVEKRLVIQNGNSGDCRFGNQTTLPPLFATHINNPTISKRQEVADGELSYTQFSRFKILNVQDDPRRSTKTLAVAVWTDDMAEDYEDEKRIHHDCKVVESNHQPSALPPAATNPLRRVHYIEAGVVNLCGEWYHTPVSPGDVIHICSLTGKYRTDSQALPYTLHTYPPPGSEVDDRILVLHPEMLMTPSIISETASCNRRAVLKAKLGSNGMSSKAALIGIMRHSLFEACMKAGQFDPLYAETVVRKLLREKADTLIGCNCSESDIQRETLNVLPAIQEFAGQYTTLRKDVMTLSKTGKSVGGMACHPDIRFLGTKVHSVEETIVSAELGLKGDIDAVLEVETTVISKKNSVSSNGYFSPGAHPQRTLMCLELKTGHNQTAQNVHMAQLSFYTFMLQSRYGSHVELNGNEFVGSQSGRVIGVQGAAPGGILLYLNHQGQQISYVAPQLNEMKTLMSQRNVVASDLKGASKPRGIILSYEEEEKASETRRKRVVNLLPAPPTVLPDLVASQHSCNRCFSNRECMLYAASEAPTGTQSHLELMKKFTAHLGEEDHEYFRTWDRLIDIEADASNRNATTAWLLDASRREKETGDSASGLVFDKGGSTLMGKNSSSALISFRRRSDYMPFRPFEDIGIHAGNNVTISTDGTLFDIMMRPSGRTPGKFRHHLHFTKGTVYAVDDDKILVSSTTEDLDKINALAERYNSVRQQLESKTAADSHELLFRIDRNETSIGIGTLRWNLINFMNGDFVHTGQKDPPTTQELIKKQRLPWLRDMIIRLKRPTFDSATLTTLFEDSSNRIPGCDMQTLAVEFDQLNVAQQDAIQKVMRAQDYALIQGLPGTGKTSTLTYLARLLVARGRRVLITAYTHSAVDNIMLKLMENGMVETDSTSGLPPLVRLGNVNTCHEGVKPVLQSVLASNLDRVSFQKLDSVEQKDVENPSASSLKKVVANARIVGVSALSAPRSPLLQGQIFDVVIIDEAGQMNQPVALGALPLANSFVLVGDHKQLPPLVNSEIAEQGGYGVSMLKRLAEKHPHAVAQLTIQYRMNEDICRVSSEAMYGGLLKCGDDRVKQQLLHLPGFPSKLPVTMFRSAFSWLKWVVDPSHPVVFVDTDNISTSVHAIKNPTQLRESKDKIEALEGKIGGKAGGSIVNRTEAILVRYIVEALYRCGSDLSDVGVISPFRAQIRVLQESSSVTSWMKQGLELSTIDKYQGRDKSTIVLSMVRSNEHGNAGRLLQDARRMNVALTRAKSKLILVGSYQTLCAGSVSLKPILKRMNNRNQRFLLPENAIDCYNIP